MSNNDITAAKLALDRATRLLLDDQHGISIEAHQALMELTFRLDPEGKSMKYLVAATSYKNRVFLEEGFEL
jgi:hypothetical protein